MFLQVVGLTQDEYEAAREWHTDAFLDLLTRRVPGLVTIPPEPRLWTTPGLAREVAEGVRRDGSSTRMVAAGGVDWAVTDQAVTLEFDAMLRLHLARMLTAWLGFDRLLRIRSPFAEVELRTEHRWGSRDRQNTHGPHHRSIGGPRFRRRRGCDGERLVGTSPPLQIRSMWLGP
jgi:hypothetical protein